MLRIVSLWRHDPIHTIVFLKLDFEPQKKGGMAVSAVCRLANSLEGTPLSTLDEFRRFPLTMRLSQYFLVVCRL